MSDETHSIYLPSFEHLARPLLDEGTIYDWCEDKCAVKPTCTNIHIYRDKLFGTQASQTFE